MTASTRRPRRSAPALPDNRPSIAELKRRDLEGGAKQHRIAVEHGATLLEIAAAALVRRDTACSCGAELGCFPDCERQIAESALIAALAKVRP